MPRLKDNDDKSFVTWQTSTRTLRQKQDFRCGAFTNDPCLTCEWVRVKPLVDERRGGLSGL